MRAIARMRGSRDRRARAPRGRVAQEWLPRSWRPCGAREPRAPQPHQLPRAPVHPRTNRRHGAGVVLGERDRGVVARHEQQAVEHRLELHLASARQHPDPEPSYASASGVIGPAPRACAARRSRARSSSSSGSRSAARAPDAAPRGPRRCRRRTGSPPLAAGCRTRPRPARVRRPAERDSRGALARAPRGGARRARRGPLHGALGASGFAASSCDDLELEQHEPRRARHGRHRPASATRTPPSSRRRVIRAGCGSRRSGRPAATRRSPAMSRQDVEARVGDHAERQASDRRTAQNTMPTATIAVLTSGSISTRGTADVGSSWRRTASSLISASPKMNPPTWAK